MFRGRGPARYSSETRSPLEEFLIRLQGLGATAEQLTEVAQNWDAFDGEWTPERRDEVIRWPDERLKAEIIDVLDEFAEGTGGPLDEAARVWVSGSIPEVLSWVGDDPDRAIAAAAAERRGKLRAKLLAKLDKIVMEAEPA